MLYEVITMLILIILESVKGKKDDFNENNPIRPNEKKAIMKMFTATWYLIK